MSDSSHFDVVEGQEVVRRTIVGGRPQACRAKTISVPIGIEKVLVRAAEDGAFRHRLFDDRAAAVAEVAPVLQPSEAAILRAVPDATLAVMIGHIDLPKHGSRRFLKGVVTAALASAALLGVVDCGGSSTGIQPDEPDADTVQETTIEVEETAASRGGQSGLPAAPVPGPARGARQPGLGVAALRGRDPGRGAERRARHHDMLLIRYVDALERELHVPLGPLYLVAALEKAGLEVDFRDYQTCTAPEPFLPEALADFCADPAPVIGLSFMANLLPFTILAAKELKRRWPDRLIVLGGVGPKAVEDKIVARFWWIDAVAHGEGERSIVDLVRQAKNGRDWSRVPGLVYRQNGGVACTEAAPRIDDLTALGWPALHRLDYSVYASKAREVTERDSCGAHSPRLDDEQTLGTLTRGEA